MNRFRSLAILLTAGVATFGSYVYAANLNFGGSTKFRKALEIDNLVNMDFGFIEYAGQHANTIELTAASDTLTCSDDTNYQCPATGTRGTFRIKGSNNNTVDISCDATGVISNGTHTLDYEDVVAEIDGVGGPCQGLGTPAFSYAITNGSGNHQLYAGMKIQITAAGLLSGGVYDTSQSGADKITFRVVYQ